MVCHRRLWQYESVLARKSIAIRIDSRYSRFVWQSHAKSEKLCRTVLDVKLETGS